MDVLTSVPGSGATTGHLAYVEVFTVDNAADQAVGGPRSTAGGAEERLAIALQCGGQGTLTQDRREAVLQAGDFTIFEAARPYELRSEGRTMCFVVPRHAVGLSSAELRRITSRTVRGDQGLGALVSCFLSGLATQAADCGPEVGERLAGHAMNLLASLFAEQLGHDGDGSAEPDASHALLLRIKTFIDEHLADPDLTPGAIASAHHVSVRYLHKLFQGEATTVSRWIKQCRLEKCCEELHRGGRSAPSVSAIAQRWGFPHPAHFTRAFRAAYGMSPSQWQAAHTTAPAR
ncbi:AraC-like DNA-binding protein [Streptomyces umbrinus]|uniref:AraC-like DNA-binding protein n=1 Tax=Streptomyces umbrinus TaxID=67370 RepID=A0ABU0TBC1_9ACTN|nr:AraC-like DNA-binding protein [Streptomyces umbrinus]